MKKHIIFKDLYGEEHIACEGDCRTGEIIYEPSKRNMFRTFLPINQAATIRKRVKQQDVLIIIRWDGKAFHATCKAA